MRHTIVKTGIQERINYLLGTNDPDPSNGGSTELTVWSAQASMIANIKRIVKALVGSATGYGRVMEGMKIAQFSNTASITINPGIGFTPAGNIIVLNIQVTKSLGTPIVGDKLYIYLMYKNQTSEINYHNSEIMGTTETPQNIIFDDKISGSDTDSTILEQVEASLNTTKDLSIDDGVYLGVVEVTGISPYVLEITHSKYGKDQSISADQIDASYTDGFTIADIRNYDGISGTTKAYVIGPNNRLRYLQILRATADTTQTTMTVQVWGYQKDGAGAIQLTDDVDVPKGINANNIFLNEYKDITIPESVYAITIKTVYTGSGSTTAATIRFVIERIKSS